MTSAAPPNYDVFISHATSDDTIVSRIHQAFTTAGVKAWVDHEQGIVYGDNWDRSIHNAINISDCALFVLSPRSARSEYCIAEWNRVLALGKKLYIALIETTPIADVPTRLGTLQYADLRLDFDGVLAKLIAAISGKLTGAAAMAPAVAAMRPITGTFPQSERDLALIGRDTDMQKIDSYLNAETRLVTILGLGGVGKTRLAVEVAYQVAQSGRFRDGVIWHRVSDFDSDLATLTYIIRDHIGLPASTDDNAIWRELDRRAVFIVLDNAEAAKAPEAFAARINHIDLSGGTRILMTSRKRWDGVHSAQERDLRAPTPKAGVRILQAMVETIKPKYVPSQAQAEDLARAGRYHPRLMLFTVSWLKNFNCDYVLNTLSHLKGRNAKKALEEMVLTTVDQMRRTTDGDTAFAILRKLAVCRGGFTFEAAEFILGEEADLSLIGLLGDWNLVQVEADRYDIDPLVLTGACEDESAFGAHYIYYKTLAEKHYKSQDYLGLDPESANLEIAFERALASGHPEDAFWLADRCFAFFRNRGRFAQRLDWFTRCWDKLQQSSDPLLRAAAQSRLGDSYNGLTTGDRRENMTRVISAYTEALRFRTADIAPLDYATTETNLGMAYHNLSMVEDRAHNLTLAINAYTEALRFRTPAATPLEYAMTQDRLGNAYWSLAGVEDRETNLGRAIAAFTEALRFQKSDAVPLDYASTQNGLGKAYRDLAKIKDRGPNLVRAIAAHRESLRFYTMDAAPVGYAIAQTNLAKAYRDLATVERRTFNLNQAIIAYTASLRVYTPEISPLDFATTQNNLGITYDQLSAIENRAANLDRAIAAYHDALRFRTAEATPLDYARTQRNLGIVLDATGASVEAANAYREAEKYYRLSGDTNSADQMLQKLTAPKPGQGGGSKRVNYGKSRQS